MRFFFRLQSCLAASSHLLTLLSQSSPQVLEPYNVSFARLHELLYSLIHPVVAAVAEPPSSGSVEGLDGLAGHRAVGHKGVGISFLMPSEVLGM
jgi:hypothetical protein